VPQWHLIIVYNEQSILTVLSIKVKKKMTLEIEELDHEKAYELADLLEDRVVFENDGSKVFAGQHPNKGSVYIVITAIGQCLVLPFAILRN
jgi:hypothetical protein